MATIGEKKCSICGRKFKEWGNDPWPVRTGKNDVCCDMCNATVVIPARLAGLNAKEKED